MVTDLGPGASYSMSPDLVHRIEVSSGPTVTLFLELARCRDWSDVYVRAGDAAPRPLRHTPYTPSQLRKRIADVCAILTDR